MENNTNIKSTSKPKVDTRKGGNILDFLPVKKIENGVITYDKYMDCFRSVHPIV